MWSRADSTERSPGQQLLDRRVDAGRGDGGRQARPDRSDGGTGPAGANQRASGRAAAEAGPALRRPVGHPGPGRVPTLHQCVPGLSGEFRLDQVM